MLSSVSYVCLDMCAGMWVISRGIYLALPVLFFISVLLFQRGVFHYEQGGTCRAFSEILRRDLRTCRFEIARAQEIYFRRSRGLCKICL